MSTKMMRVAMAKGNMAHPWKDVHVHKVIEGGEIGRAVSLCSALKDHDVLELENVFSQLG